MLPFQMITVPTGTLCGFKAMPSPSLSVSMTNQPTHWTAIYPQLSFQQAMMYVPNQFDRDVTTCYILQLYTKKPMRVLVSTDAALADVTLDSDTKAKMVQQAIVAAGVEHLRLDMPLMDACGQLEMALCVVDAENLELFVPHAMFSDEWLEFRVLLAVEQSPRRPGTVGYVRTWPDNNVLTLHPSICQDWNLLTNELSKRLEETHCTAFEMLFQS